MSNNESIVFGLHAVEALLKNQRQNIAALMVLKGRHDKKLSRLLRQAKGVAVTEHSRSELDKAANSSQHQGIVAQLQAGGLTDNIIAESTIDFYLKSIDKPLVLILDGVTDPHNFGACLRSADAAGVDLVITPKDRSVGLTPVVRKVAVGAAETIKICQVTNLARAMTQLQEMGIWIAGAAGEAEQSLYDIDFSGAMAIAMGSEGDGLRRLTKEHCDYLMKIPMQGTVESLNVSVATGICLFEASRQRLVKS
jgi:23S rRNA (guanosine2251-2'-O)-methyltransferase